MSRIAPYGGLFFPPTHLKRLWEVLRGDYRRGSLLPVSVYNLTMTTQPGDTLAIYIRRWLTEREVSQLALARRAGVPHASLSVLFNHGTIPMPSTLRKIAEVMGVPLGRLLVLAGHLNEEEYETPIRESDLARLYEVGDLDIDEWEQVRDFARYVRSKRKPRPLT